MPVFSPELAGGALYDLNIYCISTIVELFGAPKNFKYYPNIGYNGIDVSGVLLMDYGSCKAVSYTAKDCAGQQEGFIQGTKGFIRIENMPANMQDIVLTINGEAPVKIDRVAHADTREYMFRKMDILIENNEKELSWKMMEKTVDTMKLMETARKEAGIFFGEGND